MTESSLKSFREYLSRYISFVVENYEPEGIDNEPVLREFDKTMEALKTKVKERKIRNKLESASLGSTIMPIKGAREEGQSIEDDWFLSLLEGETK